MFSEIYNKVIEFSNNNGGRAPTNIKLSSELLFKIKESKHFHKFVNAMEYNDPKKPSKICGLLQVIDNNVTEIQVY